MRHFLGPDLAQELASPLPNQARPRKLKYSESDSSNQFPSSELSSGNDTTDSTGKTGQSSPCAPQPQRAASMVVPCATAGKISVSQQPEERKAAPAKSLMDPTFAQKGKQEHQHTPVPKAVKRQPYVQAPPPSVHQLLQQDLNHMQPSGWYGTMCNDYSTWQGDERTAQHVDAFVHPDYRAGQHTGEVPGEGPDNLYSHFGNLSLGDHTIRRPHAPSHQPPAQLPKSHDQHRGPFSQQYPVQPFHGSTYQGGEDTCAYKPNLYEMPPHPPQCAGHLEQEYGLRTHQSRPLHLQQPGQDFRQYPASQEQQQNGWQDLQQTNWSEQQPYPKRLSFKDITPGRPPPDNPLRAVDHNKVSLLRVLCEILLG